MGSGCAHASRNSYTHGEQVHHECTNSGLHAHIHSPSLSLFNRRQTRRFWADGVGASVSCITTTRVALDAAARCSRYHVTSHHVTSRHVTSRHVTSRHVTSRHVTSRHVTSRHVTSRHVTLRRDAMRTWCQRRTWGTSDGTGAGG